PNADEARRAVVWTPDEHTTNVRRQVAGVLPESGEIHSSPPWRITLPCRRYRLRFPDYEEDGCTARYVRRCSLLLEPILEPSPNLIVRARSSSRFDRSRKASARR